MRLRSSILRQRNCGVRDMRKTRSYLKGGCLVVYCSEAPEALAAQPLHRTLSNPGLGAHKQYDIQDFESRDPHWALANQRTFVLGIQSPMDQNTNGNTVARGPKA